MKLHLKAIFIGVFVDIALTAVASLVLFIVGVESTSPAFYVWSLALGLVAVSGGGYATARSAWASKIFNTVLYGIIEILIGFAFAIFSPSIPLWFHIASFVLVLPAALLGAYVVVRPTIGNKPRDQNIIN
jgi:hypothetical protein